MSEEPDAGKSACPVLGGVGVQLARRRREPPSYSTPRCSSSDLPKSSWVKISQIRTISTQRLGRKVGKVAPEELEIIIDGLNEIVGG